MQLTEYGKLLIPFKFTWEMTERCNLNCSLCYSINDKENMKRELNTKEAKKLLDILEKNKVLYLFLDGGEPLMREDFFELLNISTKRFCTWLSTNGTLIDKESATKMKKYNIGNVFVSMHGSQERVHESVTNVKGSFNKTLSGIENLKKQDVPITPVFQISKKNIDNIKDYIKFQKELNMKKIQFLRPYPIGNGMKSYKKLSLEPKQYSEIVKLIDSECKKNHIGYSHSFEGKNHNCCKQAFSCDTSGDFMNCPYLRFLPRLGNAIEDEAITVWNSKSSMFIREYYKNIPKDCNLCENSEDCNGGCTADRLLFAKDINTKDSICGK